MIQMKILALSDTHFGYEFGRTSSAKKKITESMYRAFEVSLENARKKKVDLILHGGDMFNRSQPLKKIIARAYKILYTALDDDITFLGIPGNHDKSILPETLLSHFNKNLKLENKFAINTFEEIAIISFPFEVHNLTNILQKIRKLANDNPRKKYLVLCHQIFDGAMFGPHNYIFRNRKDAIKIDDFPSNVILFVSGHIHRNQTLKGERVCYTGSIERTSFMEFGEKKGNTIIEIEDDKFNLEFIEIPSFPMDVFEIDISDERKLSNKLDTISVNRENRTLVRLCGRELDEREVKFLWSYYPAKEFPYLSFSPKRSEISLRCIYSRTDV